MKYPMGAAKGDAHDEEERRPNKAAKKGTSDQTYDNGTWYYYQSSCTLHVWHYTIRNAWIADKQINT